MTRFAAFVSLLSAGWLGLWLTNRIPLSVDRGPSSEPAIAAAIDLTLILLFGLQHSVMARAWWKRRIERWMPERSAYLLATAAALAALFLLWRPIPSIVWQLPQVITAGQFFGALLATWAVATLDARAFLGLQQAPPGLRTTGPYRWIQHPIVVGTLLVLWCSTTMTVGHLLFSSAMTVYSLIGTVFEGRDLKLKHSN